MMYSFSDCLEIIEKEISNMELPDMPGNLYNPILYTLENGGKRLRPALVLMSCNLFNDDITDAINAAIGIEMFHNFTLLHDDIMDKSDVRRNKPTVHKKWNENVAILSGDAMIIKSYEYMSLCPKSKVIAVLEIFNETALQVCEGQQYDMDFELQAKVSESDYLRMIELKTSVLIASSLKIGAILGNASPVDADLLFEFGKNMGIAFQLQDDLLDVFAESEIFGKIPGNDIVSNKKTFLLVNALNKVKGASLKELKKWLEKTSFNKEEKVNAIKKIFCEFKIKEDAENSITYYFEKALEYFKLLIIEKEKKTYLLELMINLINREK